VGGRTGAQRGRCGGVTALHKFTRGNDFRALSALSRNFLVA
jgi:hypothetical protein